MRVVVFFLLAFSIPALSAQGRYIEHGVGASLQFSRTAVDMERGRSAIGAAGVSLVAVGLRVQSTMSVSRTSLGDGVSAYSVGTQLGFLVLHQPVGEGATLGLNGGLSAVFLSGGEASLSPTFVASVGPELSFGIPLSATVHLVPGVFAERAIPFGLGGDGEEASSATALGGTLGLRVRAGEALLFVMEPGWGVSEGAGTAFFSLKLLGGS